MVLRLLAAMAMAMAMAVGSPGLAVAKKRNAACGERASARILDVSMDAAFIDAGRADGLTPGHQISVRRRGRQVGRCKIDALADHHARCTLARARAGDLACFEAASPASAAAVPVRAGPAAARPGTGERQRVRGRLLAAAGPRVEDQASPNTGSLAFRADAALRHDSFVIIGSDRDGFHRQAVNVSIRDAPLGFIGATASADLTVLVYAARPQDARFRGERRVQLYVHETAVSRRADGDRLVLSVGRIRPRHAVGISYLDGAQVGLRVTDQLELGVIGGALPDLVALGPHLDRWLAGAYGAYSARHDGFRFDVEGRGGVVRGPQSGLRAEFETRIGAALRRAVFASAALRVDAGDGGARLASARGRIDVNPGAGFRVTLDGRLRGGGPDAYAPAMAVVAADHARAGVHWQGWSSLSVGVVGGVGRFRADDLTRASVGPEVGLPDLFGAAGGLWLAYQEAVGWLPGRNAWAQVGLRPVQNLRLWVRASYLEDREDAGVLREVGGFTQLDWRLSSFVELRATLLGRVALTDLQEVLPRAGVTARASVIAHY